VALVNPSEPIGIDADGNTIERAPLATAPPSARYRLERKAHDYGLTVTRSNWYRPLLRVEDKHGHVDITVQVEPEHEDDAYLQALRQLEERLLKLVRASRHFDAPFVGRGFEIEADARHICKERT
jgi:hypothetical protein